MTIHTKTMGIYKNDKGYSVAAVSPLVLHGEESLGLQDGTYQRVHLTHVAAEPEEPTTGTSDHQDNLQQVSQLDTFSPVSEVCT